MTATSFSFRPRRSFDWRRAARLWAAGIEVSVISRATGIDDDYFWRHLERSPRFRRFVEIARAEQTREMVNLISDKLRISTAEQQKE